MAEYDPIDRDEPLPTTTRARRRGRYGLGTVMIGVIAVGGVAAVAALAYQEGLRRGAESVTPTITAADGPAKVRPEEPGGMQVPNQDKRIFDRFAPDHAAAAQPGVERLLPGPEAPLPPPVPPPRVQAAAAPPPAAAEPPAAGKRPHDQVEPPPTVVPIPPSEPQAAPPSPAPASSTAAAPPQSVREVVKAAAVAPHAGGAFRVQMASVRTPEAARNEVGRFKRTAGDLLDGLALDVKRADLGDKGVFYRVQAGPLADAGAAAGLCDRLKERKLGCVVVRP